jgi:hypothetical protein
VESPYATAPARGNQLVLSFALPDREILKDINFLSRKIRNSQEQKEGDGVVMRLAISIGLVAAVAAIFRLPGWKCFLIRHSGPFIG